ncbi:MAG TPA: hypothetical protein VI700_06795 [Thermoanaerobaculaceae bacterium]|nr:hypothetical protein [Thermoanaerobaculaceae bacterium]
MRGVPSPPACGEGTLAPPIPRARPAGEFSLGLLATDLGFPFFVLLPARTNRGRTSLGVVAAGILTGLFGEHLLLVLPSLPVRADAPSVVLGVLVALGVLGLFVLTVGGAIGAAKGNAANR